MSGPASHRAVQRTCHLCEALCGLTMEVRDGQISKVGSDKQDVFSKGYACPKGIAIPDLMGDPDRLDQPVMRAAGGSFEPISWADAYEYFETEIRRIQRRYGRDAVAFYQGNPSAHQLGTVLFTIGFIRALGTVNSYNAASQDTNPRFAVSYTLYGSPMTVPIPDVDRTGFFLCLGANPLISNGSVMSAPNMHRRLRAIRQRGGTVVVVDPVRTATAEQADWHLAIRPGGDAALLFSLLNVLVKASRIDEAALVQTSGWDAVEPRLALYSPERASAVCGIAPEDIRRLAHAFADAESAVCYTRVGVCLNRHSTLASWAGDLLNIATGNLGRIGGAMFPTPVVDISRLLVESGDMGLGRWHSRVRGLPETMSILPTAALAEEIETPGTGQVRSLVTLMGNPVLSAPNGKRLDRALGKLDFIASIDCYVNETTRHANLILPTASAVTQDYFPVIFANWSVRNIARWSPPALPDDGVPSAGDVMQELALRLGGGPTGSRQIDGLLKLLRRFGIRLSPAVMLAALIRSGPYGDKFRPFGKGLTLKEIRRHPHGLDLGPMQEGLRDRVFHPDGKIHLVRDEFLEALDAAEIGWFGKASAAEAGLEPDSEYPLLLIGRRELKSNNSWMHNVGRLKDSETRCTLWISPADAGAAGLTNGERAVLRSSLHADEVPVTITERIRPGVVSLPHGYGHAGLKRWQRVASRDPGVSFNDWSSDQTVEAVVAQSILNGIPVAIEQVRS